MHERSTMSKDPKEIKKGPSDHNAIKFSNILIKIE
jgi:hypothetical protein